DDAKLTLSGQKTLNGRTIVDGEFTFELYAVDKNTGAETLKDSKTNVGNAFTFDELTFDAEGEYKYVVKEKAGNDGKITYDTKSYEVIVTVTNENGVLKATKTVDGKAETAIAFTNTYTPPAEPPVEEPPVEEPPVEEPPVEEPPVETPPADPVVPSNPDTGDHFNLNLWIALLFVSGGILAITVFGVKKKIEE
ncbi:MAG: hypothetical protein IJ333_03670, partial [Clostridia bacterium]|nr:hypothetical protein [Clostridia bacterium]